MGRGSSNGACRRQPSHSVFALETEYNQRHSEAQCGHRDKEMKAVNTSGVQPAILRWARQSIGLSTNDVATKMKRPPDEIEEWESGSSAPTYSQLEKLAYEVYKRPLAMFFMPTTPDESQPQQEFRSLPDSELLSLQPDTRLRIRYAHAYQYALKELFGGRNPSDNHIWKRIHLSPDRSAVEQGAVIRDALGISLGEQVTWTDNDRALKEWRSAIEASGVFVFKWTFKQKDISGLSLLDSEFPIIYVNNSNAKSRQSFSLFHELAHILLNLNGICKDDIHQVNDFPGGVREIEQFCNRIAAEVLVPISDFVEQTKRFPTNADQVDDQTLADLAARYSVSREVILRRLLDQGRLTAQSYNRRVQGWMSQLASGSGGNYYATINAYLSQRFAQEVVRQHSRNQLTVEQAAELLGIKARSYATLEQHIVRGEVA
jgi:Zn-dependent peptidase ImmA (M78 family)/DNA-binding transcriptional regulator YiaG